MMRATVPFITSDLSSNVMGCNAFDFIPMEQELRPLRDQHKGDHEGPEKTAPFGKPPALSFASEVT
jgi:hypothetical protein